MPLGSNVNDTSLENLCGIETSFYQNFLKAFQFNFLEGPFDFILSPLMNPEIESFMDEDESHKKLMIYAGSELEVTHSQWSSLVHGKIAPWLDLDSNDEKTKTDSEATLKKQIEWASYLGVQACVLPTPKGKSCANYARCVNQILQGLKNMQLLVRFPFGMSDEDCSSKSKDMVDSWETWNSFRLLCDHHSQLTVVLDIMSNLPPENSQERWYGEPVSAAILDSDIFLTKTRGKKTMYLAKRHQKLIADFFDHCVQIIISGLEVPPIDALSSAGSTPHPLMSHWDLVSNIYRLRPPLSEKEHNELGIRDFIQPPLRPFRNYSSAMSYGDQENDLVKYLHYGIAITKALQDRVPKEKASKISTVLVVVGAGRGSLVSVSLQELIWKNNWANIVSIVSSDVRDWSPPERADILVSDLLGSFGDNEMSPEILDDAQRFLEKDGISIPSSYSSFLQPLTASKLYSDIKARKEILHSESAFVVKIHDVARLAPSQEVFTFTHPKCFDEESNQRYQKLCFVMPNDTGSAIVHGFAGYFNATLYKDVYLRTEPSNATKNLMSWDPMYFPLRTPMCLNRSSRLEVHFWRCVDSRKVWYEWCVTSPSPSPIHNCNGRSCWMDLK